MSRKQLNRLIHDSDYIVSFILGSICSYLKIVMLDLIISNWNIFQLLLINFSNNNDSEL